MNYNWILYFFLIVLSSCNAQNHVDYLTGRDLCYKAYQEKLTHNDGRYLRPDQDCFIGYLLPEFLDTTINSKLINEDYFKSKYTVITFWNPGCRPCINELPEFKRIIETVGTEKFNFLAFTTRKLEKAMTKIPAFPIEFDHCVDATDVIRGKFKLYFGYPYTIVVDKDMVIIETFGNLLQTQSDPNFLDLLGFLKMLK